MPRLGVDYYPEHWSHERWETDAVWMQEAGITLVRLAEFAWSRMEPAPGRFQFDWLHDAVDILNAHGMQVVLGTPTAAPPAWMIQARPDILPHDAQGHPAPFGGRRHYCFNNQTYWKYSDLVVAAMLDEFANDPRIAAWQIDNELAGHCFCPRCEAAFREWLKAKYESLDNVNKAWGTVFWSQEYTDWNQIPLPRLGPGGNNPGMHLDFHRFTSDGIVKYQKRQIDLIRARSPQARITHNTMTMSVYSDVDLYNLSADLDFASWDNYPMWTKDAVAPSANAMAADYVRGLKRRNFWILEQQSGAGGSRSFGRFPAPGEIRLWTWQSVARGADAVVYFRWRTACFGAEQYWHGILDHSGIRNRRFEEVKRVGSEFAALGNVLEGSEPRHDVAFVNTYASRWALGLQPGNEKLEYFGHFEKWHAALFSRGIGADILNDESWIDRYKVVFAPTLHVMSEQLAQKLAGYVRNGGTLVATFRTSVKRENNQVMDQPLPGLLTDVFGCTVDEYQSLDKLPGVPVHLKSPSTEKIFKSCTFNDILKPGPARVAAVYAGEHYRGKPAITINRYGNGLAVYVGFEADADFYQTFVPWILKQSGLPCGAALPDKVETVVRESNGHRYRFWLNYNEKSVKVRIGKGGTDMLTGKNVVGEQILPSFGVMIVAEK